MQIFPDTFALAPAPQGIATRLIADIDRFAIADAARIACLFSERQLFLHGAPCNAIIAVPQIQGVNRWLFEWMLAMLTKDLCEGYRPDFVIYFDRAIWDGLDDIGRERLVFHELCHIAACEDEDGTPKLDDEGRPKLKLVPHDTELFDDEIIKYGVEVCGAEHTAIAIAEGESNKRRRGLKLA